MNSSLGCGAGGLTAKIQSWGGKASGIDISESMIQIAKSEHPNLEFHIGDIAKTPFEKNAFDLACSSLVLHYFDDIKPPIKEAARILKPGGIFVFSMHHPFTETFTKVENSQNLNRFYAGEYFHQKKYEWKMLDGMILQSYHHTFEPISKACFQSGFTIETICEPRPEEKDKNSNPEAFLETRDHPIFVIFKCKLT